MTDSASTSSPPQRERYEPSLIEPKWQAYWESHATFRAERHEGRRKLYVLDMFPYPSGTGLHVGHPEGYTATDIVARFSRMRGIDVLHPMGWDAFGLPAEQHAIATNTHPRDTTGKNIATFRRQLKMLGFSYDWSREIDTTDPGYVRWTQWIFLKLFERGLAYQAKVPVNWCAALGTVLANEEIVDGLSERGGYPVERLPLRQWMLKITAYADRLADDLAPLDWPDSRAKQIHWIGRSEGAEIDFEVVGTTTSIRVFTTRADTLPGVTYVVLAPEHPLVAELSKGAPADVRAAVDAYVAAARRKSDFDRTEAKTKTGVPLGARVRNPIDGREVPIWVGDYVIATYGTGAVMAVPAHDERDHAFALAYDLPIEPGDRAVWWRPLRRQEERVHGRRRDRVRADRHRHPAGNPQRRRALAHHRLARVEQAWRSARDLPPARLGLLAAAVLGRAHSHLFPRHVRRRPARARRRVHRASRPAHRGRRGEPSGEAPRSRRLPSRHRPRRAARARSGLALLPEGRTLVRPRDQHDAAVGGLLLVLPALSRPPRRPRGLDGRRTTPTGCPSTSTSAAASTRSCTCSTPASGTRCSSTSAW